MTGNPYSAKRCKVRWSGCYISRCKNGTSVDIERDDQRIRVSRAELVFLIRDLERVLEKEPLDCFEYSGVYLDDLSVALRGGDE